ncbi:regulator of nonsense transcripts UPF3-like isoform X2 [Durio zibethinus]|uniref:Regulator of nonsense transcripts UPF3-like isoform X2 n=1 Tax=Durio zibethinus TaxID=66656 RepID=A0A6P5XI02_DURZI|nr:regulator of nonsense transcripts UPF3-like isoform X2 [Durio zibethinus]
MKGTLDRTKVVLRHLPPAITEAMLVEQVDSAFAGRYNWLSFRPGKSSQKHQSYSRAYIDFKRPQDVLEFAEFLNGHVFVNEKGAQFKTVVEYAPSQRVPKQWSKKDGREGTIFKDPEYLEFLEFLAKPVENLPSAEIQLERREAERAGVPKGAPIVTPLMDFVRQKRAAKGRPRRSLSNGKLSRRAGGSSGGSPSSVPSKRGSEKRRGSTTMVAGSMLCQQNVVSPIKNILGSTTTKHNSRREGRMIRGILINKDSLQSQSSGVQSDLQILTSNLEKDRRPAQHSHAQLVLKDTNSASDDKVVGNELHGSEKPERRSRNKDRPDRGVWTLRRSDGSYASDEFLSSSASLSSRMPLDSSEGIGAYGDTKVDLSNVRSIQVKTVTSGRNSSLDDGSHKHISRRGAVADVSSVVSDGKPGKRGNTSGYGSHEKQVWVQKSSSGS